MYSETSGLVPSLLAERAEEARRRDGESGMSLLTGSGGGTLRAGLQLLQPSSNMLAKRDRAQIARLFNLPMQKRWKLRWHEERQQLEIGPLIGVLVSVCKPGRTPMARSTDPCRLMARVWERRFGMVVFFQLEDIDMEARRIRGCHWQQGAWRWGSFPLPSVIYNRISHRSIESSEAYREFRAGYSKKGGLIFNPHYLDKWSAHRLLYTSPQVSKALPASLLLENRDQLQRYLRHYSRVYLKPISGSQGRGIVMLQLSSPGVTMRYSSTGLTKRLSGLDKVPKQFFDGTYLLQQGLYLMSRMNEPIDLRLLMQKNEVGRWKRTKSFARVGSKRGIVSNISQGGMAIPIAAALQQAFPTSTATRKRVRRSITRVAHAVCASFDKIPGEHWGELGIDIGVDHHGKVWLIEVNARPWKRAYVITGNRLQMLKALVRPLEHAVYLSGFARKEAPYDLAAGES